ncbi:MAG: metabolite traffic protein EboE [Lentisphaeria bacterium]|jgi:sugar phosphate isomerase/epimerase
MRHGPFHLTYCLNIHPGESWAENFAAIRDHALAVRHRVAPGARFGLGLRLSGQAAAELAGDRRALAEFKRFLRREKLYVFTVNAFPFGRFHGGPVKEQVYAPDWRTPQRLGYTLRVAELLAHLLPRGVTGSISTVPGSWRGWGDGPEAWADILLNLAKAVLGLAALRERTGKAIVLALEPEPDCLLARTADLLRLWRLLRGPGVVPRLARARGVRTAALRRAFARHLGVCLDTCHFAVEFENPATALAALRAARIPVAKIQVSAAPLLRATGTAAADAAGLDAAAALAEPVYLHQTRLRLTDGSVAAFPDLAPALAAARAGGWRELRTHFHIPLGLESWGALGSTRAELDAAFFQLLAAGAAPQVELETYSFQALPAELRHEGVEASLAAEFRWFLERLAAAAGP